MLLIKNGRVIDPARKKKRNADIVVKDGKIEKIYAEGTLPAEAEAAANQVLDAKGLVVAPGLVDVHVHFRDPGLTYKEDIHTGAAAAAKGGFTTVVCMANTKPIVDNEETLRYVLEEGKKTGIHVLSCAAISKGFEGKERTDMEGLLKAGAAGFTDDGIPLMDGPFVKEAMEEAARLDTVLSFHEEDKTFIKQNGINHGKMSDQLGIYGSPALAEDSLVARDCMIALATGAKIDIQHISSGHSVEMVRLAKKMGAHVWAEVTPHHFTLTEDAVLEHGTLAKMNPPLRTEWDRQMLIEGLKDGTIDMIATDHAPHSKEEKEKPITEAPSGITGLETSLALGITSLVKPGHLTLMELMEKMSLNPAKLYKLACGKKPDAPADTTAPTQTESQTEASAEETTKPDETPSETQVPEDTESTKFYMLQGTVTKAEKDGSAFTLLADDGNEYTIALSDIRDVETEIEKNIQIAIACMKDASGDPEKAAYIVAFPEQEEWTISTDEGITTSNAMSTFMIQTSDGKEIGFIKDNCPSDENALTSDSGDSVIVTYVTSDNANFPLEIRKGK